MTAQTEQRAYEPLGTIALWLVVSAGPIIWAQHLVVSYALVTLSCMWGFFLQHYILGMTLARFILLVFTLAATLVILYAGWVALRHWRQTVGDDPEGVGTPELGRYRFMLFSAMGLNALFGFITLFTGVPGLYLSWCVM